jgi:hypothetical protein
MRLTCQSDARVDFGNIFGNGLLYYLPENLADIISQKYFDIFLNVVFFRLSMSQGVG